MELPRSVGAQYATGDQWRNNSIKKEGMEPKQKQYPAVDVTGDRSKVRCCKEQYGIGTWNVRSTNQGKLEVVKQEMARVNVDILGISELNAYHSMLQNKKILSDCIFEYTPNERILATSLLGRRKQLLRGLVGFQSGMTLSSSVF